MNLHVLWKKGREKNVLDEIYMIDLRNREKNDLQADSVNAYLHYCLFYVEMERCEGGEWLEEFKRNNKSSRETLK